MRFYSERSNTCMHIDSNKTRSIVTPNSVRNYHQIIILSFSIPDLGFHMISVVVFVGTWESVISGTVDTNTVVLLSGYVNLHFTRNLSVACKNYYFYIF